MVERSDRARTERIRRKLASKLVELGFRRTKTSFFTRPRKHWVEFIHLHKFTFTTGFRVHFGVRVLNDSFDAIALNGPDSDTAGFRLNFGQTEESANACVDEICVFCKKKGEKWFRRIRRPTVMLWFPNSPLGWKERKALLMAIRGKVNHANVERSKELLGLE
jgi:hypothetical protein